MTSLAPKRRRERRLEEAEEKEEKRKAACLSAFQSVQTRIGSKRKMLGDSCCCFDELSLRLKATTATNKLNDDDDDDDEDEQDEQEGTTVAQYLRLASANKLQRPKKRGQQKWRRVGASKWRPLAQTGCLLAVALTLALVFAPTLAKSSASSGADGAEPAASNASQQQGLPAKALGPDEPLAAAAATFALESSKRALSNDNKHQQAEGKSKSSRTSCSRSFRSSAKRLC